ncbi:MAG: hypothetical protein ACRC2H_08320 [Silanimonas sp.]
MYRSIVLVHIACGVIALATYWMAGLSKKGSPFHKSAGKAYLASMVGIVLSSIYLAASFFIDGKPVGGTFLAYLVVITATAMWTGWTAIRRKRDQSRFRDRSYVALALVNVLSGGVVFAFGLKVSDALLMGFCWIGIVTGLLMLWRAWKPLDETKWWLREHIAAMLGCGIATHVAFLSIGLNRLTSLLGIEANLGLLPWFGPVAVATAASVWLSRKYLTKPAAKAQAVSAG